MMYNIGLVFVTTFVYYTIIVKAQNNILNTDPVPIQLSMPSALVQCYTFDGKGNNIKKPQWGGVEQELLRAEGSRYYENNWEKQQRGPNPRVISNALSHETCSSSFATSERCQNDWYWLWGQMLDHDMTAVSTFPEDSKEPHTRMGIQIPENDPFLAGQTMIIPRSKINSNKEQYNMATAFIDASQIYGTSEMEANTIRAFKDGMLLITDDGFMPILKGTDAVKDHFVPTFSELGSPNTKLMFLCTDMRCNQHGPMAALQTMFIREHNRIAKQLAESNHPLYSTDDIIYHAARACVIAQIQAITVNEFLPLTLGSFDIPPYDKYKKDVNPGISNMFTAAAFRIPHSMIGCDYKEVSNDGEILRSISYANAFFDSTWIRGAPSRPQRSNREQNAYQTVMNGLALNPSSRMDARVAPVFRSILFAPTIPGLPTAAFDLVAADIARGRDHGLVSYSEARTFMGWDPITTMQDITLDTKISTLLEKLYRNDTNRVDLYVGMLTEDTLLGGAFGPVTTSIIRDQFLRTRDGDRCWFENIFSGALLNVFKNTRLRDIVDRTFMSTGVSSLFNTQNVNDKPNTVERNGMTLHLDADPFFNEPSFTTTTVTGATTGNTNTFNTLSTDNNLNDTNTIYIEDLDVDLLSIDSTVPRNITSYPRVNTQTTRPANIFDDVVGYVCNGISCEPRASINDPDVSQIPDIYSFATQIRDALRVPNGSPQQPEQQASSPGQQTLSPGQQIPPPEQQTPSPEQQTPSPEQQTLFPGQQAPFPGQQAPFPGQQLGQQTTMDPLYHNNFNPTGVPFGTMNHHHNGRTMETFQTAGIRTQQSPAPGVITSTIRASLASVNSNVLVNNIFVTPACRL